MEGIFRISAVVLIGVAAFFLWSRIFEVAFISAAVGCVSFFLSVRSQVKERVDKRNAEIISRQDEAQENEQLDQSELLSISIQAEPHGVDQNPGREK